MVARSLAAANRNDRSRAGPDDSHESRVHGLFELYRVVLVQTMRTRLDTADAEDVVQEIFLKAWRDISWYDATRSSPRTWLSRIGDQVQARHFRSYFRRQRAEEVNQSNNPTAGLTPEEKEDLRQLLLKLVPLNRKIITARFLLDESVEDIAARHDLSEEAVWKRIARSLSILRKAASKPATGGQPET